MPSPTSRAGAQPPPTIAAELYARLASNRGAGSYSPTDGQRIRVPRSDGLELPLRRLLPLLLAAVSLLVVACDAFVYIEIQNMTDENLRLVIEDGLYRDEEIVARRLLPGAITTWEIVYGGGAKDFGRLVGYAEDGRHVYDRRLITDGSERYYGCRVLVSAGQIDSAPADCELLFGTEIVQFMTVENGAAFSVRVYLRGEHRALLDPGERVELAIFQGEGQVTVQAIDLSGEERFRREVDSADAPRELTITDQ